MGNADKLTSEITKAVLARYVRELKQAIRGEKMAGYTFSSDETPIKMDAEQRNATGQFVSVSHFVYTGFPACS